MYTICVKFMEIGSLVLVKREKRSSSAKRSRGARKKAIIIHSRKNESVFSCSFSEILLLLLLPCSLFFENSYILPSTIHSSTLSTFDLTLDSQAQKGGGTTDNRESAIGIAERLAGNKTGRILCENFSIFIVRP